MLKHRSLSTTAATFFFILVGIGIAYADVAPGEWKLTAGQAQACSLTLAADRSATGCPGVARWKPTQSGLLLIAPNGDVYAQLKAKDETFQGKTFGVETKVTLSH